MSRALERNYDAYTAARPEDNELYSLFKYTELTVGDQFSHPMCWSGKGNTIYTIRLSVFARKREVSIARLQFPLLIRPTVPGSL